MKHTHLYYLEYIWYFGFSIQLLSTDKGNRWQAPSTLTWQSSWSMTFIHLFTLQTLDSYYVPDTVLGTADTKMNDKGSPPLRGNLVRPNSYVSKEVQPEPEEERQRGRERRGGGEKKLTRAVVTTTWEKWCNHREEHGQFHLECQEGENSIEKTWSTL